MKKILIALLVITMLVAGVSVLADIGVTINGVPLEMEVPPAMINNRTMVPLRAIAEALDARVEWNQELQQITIYAGDRVCILTVNENVAAIFDAGGNANISPLDVPPTIIDNRTLVPVRFFAEFFGSVVDWDQDTQTVIIER